MLKTIKPQGIQKNQNVAISLFLSLFLSVCGKMAILQSFAINNLFLITHKRKSERLCHHSLPNFLLFHEMNACCLTLLWSSDTNFKIQRKTIFFTYTDHRLQLISKIRRFPSHFIFEAAVKVSRVCNLGPFSLQTNGAYFHIKHTCRPQIIV